MVWATSNDFYSKQYVFHEFCFNMNKICWLGLNMEQTTAILNGIASNVLCYFENDVIIICLVFCNGSIIVCIFLSGLWQQEVTSCVPIAYSLDWASKVSWGLNFGAEWQTFKEYISWWQSYSDSVFPFMPVLGD